MLYFYNRLPETETGNSNFLMSTNSAVLNQLTTSLYVCFEANLGER